MRSKVFLIVLALLLSTGCATKTTNTANTPPAPAPTLPTNAIDSTDANAFRVIADAWAFISPIQKSVAAGTTTLTATQKTILNDLITTYNSAYTLGYAYHNKASTDAAGLKAATNSLQTKLTAASSQIVAPTSSLRMTTYEEGAL